MDHKFLDFDWHVRSFDDAGLPVSHIAYRLNVSRGAVRRALVRLGRDGSTHARTRAQTEDDILALDDDGVPTKQIAMRLGVSEDRVRTVRRRHGRTDRSVPGRIDDATAEEIFRLHRQGWTIRALANRYGRGRRAIKTALQHVASGPRRDRDTRRRTGIDPEARSAIRTAYGAGVPVIDLVSRHQRTEDSIRNMVRDLEPQWPQTKRLTRVGLRELRRQGHDIHAIARMTGNTTTVIREWLAREGLAYPHPLKDGIRLILDHDHSLQAAAAAVETPVDRLRRAAQKAQRERQAHQNLLRSRKEPAPSGF